MISTSRAKRYRRCPRLDYFESELRMVPAHKDPNLVFGTLGHLGLEAWWRAAPEDRLAAAFEALASERDPYDRAKAEALLVGYHDAWSSIDMDVLAVEQEFEAPLVNPTTGAESKTWLFGGRIDAIARIDGRVYVIEHKTSSEDISRGSVYWQRLTLDSQVSNYITGARRLGYDPSGVYYDVVRKPELRPLRATPIESRRYRKSDGKLDARQREGDETPDEFHNRLLDEIEAKRGTPGVYFVRGVVVRLPDEERAGEANLWMTAVQVRESRNRGMWPQNPDACFRFNKPCDFLPVCVGTADINDPTRYQPKPKEEVKKL